MPPPKDLLLGRLSLAAIDDPITEMLGSELTNVGESTAVGQRRAKGFTLTLIVHGYNDPNPAAAGNRMRRQLRAMMQNHPYRLAGIYVQIGADPERNGWVVIGQGELSDADGGVTFGSYKLSLSQAFLVGNLVTYRDGYRVDLTDRRLASTPIDYFGQVVGAGAGFASLPALALSFLPVGASDAAVLDSPVASGQLIGSDGTVPIVAGRSTGDVLSWERAESDLGKGDVVVLDRRGGPYEAISTDDSGAVTHLESYGHSYIAGYPVLPSQSLTGLLATWYGLSGTGFSLGGAALQTQIGPGLTGSVLSRPAGGTPCQVAVVMWGVNDIGAFGASFGGFAAALRLMLSRIRTLPGAVAAWNDPTLSCDGSWSTLYVSTIGYTKVSTVNGSVATIVTPAGFAGGAIAVLSTFSQTTGAVYTFAVDGQVVGSWDTRSLAPAPPAPDNLTAGCFRLTVPAGAHTISIAASAIVGHASLFGWQAEANSALPVVALIKQPIPLGYGVYAGWFHTPTNADVAALNASIVGVAAEFDSYVAVVDPQPWLGSSPANFYTDGLHPNVNGYRQLAGAVEQALDASPHVTVSSPQPSAWEEVYGPDQPLSSADVPVLSNGLCRLRYDWRSVPGFRVDAWTAGGWSEQGKIIFFRAGNQNGWDDTLVSATVLEWTPDRAVVQALLSSSADAYSRERVLITLQRGWNGPRVEVYAAPTSMSSPSSVYIRYALVPGDVNDSVVKVDYPAAYLGTAGSASAAFPNAVLGASGFPYKNEVALLRQPAALQVNIAALQSSAIAVTYFDNAAYTAVSNVIAIGAAGYVSAQLGFCAQAADQIVEAESARYPYATASQVSDPAASGGQCVMETQTAETAPTLYKAATDLAQAKYRVLVRAKVSALATGNLVASLGSGNSYQIATTSTAWTWIDLSEAMASAPSAPVVLYAWVVALPTPAAPILGRSATGGTLPASTYNYRISALNAVGGTLPGPEAAVAAVTTGSASSVAVSWSAVAGATGYCIYGRTPRGELLIATLGNVLTWTDAGAVTPSGAMPTVDSSAGAVYVDRVELFKMEDRVAPGCPYNGARDLAASVLYDSRVQTRRVGRG